MKTLKLTLTIGVLALLVTSCQKNSPAPTQTNSSSSTTTVTLTTQEALLIGDWVHDKNEVYSNGVIIPGGTSYFTDSLVYHIKFNATASSSPLDPTALVGTYKECYDGTSAGDIQTYWRITPNGKLQLSTSQYTIVSLTSTNLVYYTGSLINGSGVKYYLHKMQ